MKTLGEIIPFPFLLISTMCLSQGSLSNIIQLSKSDPLSAWSCKFYSTIFFNFSFFSFEF